MGVVVLLEGGDKGGQGANLQLWGGVDAGNLWLGSDDLVGGEGRWVCV